MSPINEPPHLQYLEWESLNEEHHIEKPTLPLDIRLPGTATKLEIQRTYQYSLKATISGPPDKSYTPEDITPGGFIPSFEIKGTDKGERYELTGCFIRSIHPILFQSEDSTTKNEFQVDLGVQEIRRIRTSPESSPLWLTEWYLNGVHSQKLFNRWTTHRSASEYLRKRNVYRNPEQRFKRDDNCSGDSYAYIKCPEFGFIVHQVLEGLGPTWSKSIGIEYREEFGRIPEAPEREAVGKIVGFIMGKDLINVGYTTFDESGYPLERCAIQPWRQNIISLCQAPARPPIRFPILTSQSETVLQDLVPKYLEMRKDLNLNEALVRYWIGEALPIGADVPIIANGIEILADGWFKSGRSKIKNVYMPKEEFSALITEGLSLITNKLEGNPNKDVILGKMRNANAMGSGKKIEQFFQDLGLSIGTLEREAMKKRNAMIHGIVPMSSQEEIDNVVRLSFAYRVLFHRVLLKVLGYTGRYIDYATLGLPEREINEGIDKVPA